MKSIENKLISITQVCQSCHTTSRTLYFYEEKNLLKSIRVGENAIRYYTIEEIEKLKKIQLLRHFGVSIEEIKKILEGKNLIYSLDKTRSQMIKEKLKQEEQLNLVEKAIKILEEEKEEMLGDLIQKNRWEWIIPFIEHTTNLLMKGNLEEFYNLFGELMKTLISKSYLKKLWEKTIEEAGVPNSIKKIWEVKWLKQNKIGEIPVEINCERNTILLTYIITDKSILYGIYFEVLSD